jgi:hypothetical protein
VLLGHDSLAVQGGDERELEPFDEAPHMVVGSAADRTEPSEHGH